MTARGLLFDEFRCGDVHESGARTVTDDDIATFARVSGDFNPLHVDEAFARRTHFRGRIAHGLLVQSISSGLAHDMALFEGTLVALLEMLIRFQAPVRPGDTIRTELRVHEKEPEPGPRRGWVRFRTRVVNQRGEAVIEGEWLTLIQRERTERGARGAQKSPAE